jgi:hypothetical protein
MDASKKLHSHDQVNEKDLLAFIFQFSYFVSS